MTALDEQARTRRQGGAPPGPQAMERNFFGFDERA
jgi:hypothetical protein